MSGHVVTLYPTKTRKSHDIVVFLEYDEASGLSSRDRTMDAIMYVRDHGFAVVNGREIYSEQEIPSRWVAWMTTNKRRLRAGAT